MGSGGKTSIVERSPWSDFCRATSLLILPCLAVVQNGPVAVDLFLRTLNAIHEDVVSTEGSGYISEVANRVKDGMRENCLPQIADAWYSILQLHSSAPELCANCLNTIHLFISWIDISLVANQRCAILFPDCLASVSPMRLKQASTRIAMPVLCILAASDSWGCYCHL